jgi:hypothetical protein
MWDCIYGPQSPLKINLDSEEAYSRSSVLARVKFELNGLQRSGGDGRAGR